MVQREDIFFNQIFIKKLVGVTKLSKLQSSGFMKPPFRR